MFRRERLEEVRAAVKAECERRNGYGSMERFTSVDYNIASANTGDIIRVAHGKGIIDPLVHIKDFGDLALVEEGRPIPDSFNDDIIMAYVNELKAETMDGNKTSCRGACTGLCMGTCSNTCKGCTDSCKGGCNTGCNTSCGNGCSYSCGDACAGGCYAYSV